jgi:CRISPR-associated Csx2 family protein
MSHVLITFIGKGDKNTTDGFYQSEQYHFEKDKKPYYEQKIFGLAVLEHLANKNSPPDKLVVLGTPSSMWNGLYEIDGEVDSQYEDEWLTLDSAIEKNAKSPKDEKTEKNRIVGHLATLTDFLNEQLDGVECDLRVISYGEDQTGQIAILKEMADSVNKGDTVSLDITHGLRHLPMLVVLSAMYLQVVKKVTIEGIYYGARDLKDRHKKIAPALNLSGLLGIADWVGALSSFEKDGDYAVFGKLLEKEGLTTDQIEPLEEAAFFERIFNIPQSASKLTAFRNQMPENLPGIGNLFSDTLNERTMWATQNNLYNRQRELAKFFWNKKDYLRAAILAVEAFVTHRMVSNGYRQEDICNYKERDPVSKDLSGIQDRGKREAFDLIKKLRNTMAHSNEPEGNDVKNAMKSQYALKSKLEKLMTRLLTG